MENRSPWYIHGACRNYTFIVSYTQEIALFHADLFITCLYANDGERLLNAMLFGRMDGVNMMGRPRMLWMDGQTTLCGGREGGTAPASLAYTGMRRYYVILFSCCKSLTQCIHYTYMHTINCTSASLASQRVQKAWPSCAVDIFTWFVRTDNLHTHRQTEWVSILVI